MVWYDIDEIEEKKLDKQADEIMSNMLTIDIYLYTKRKLKEDLKNRNINFKKVNKLTMKALAKFMLKNANDP